jgi:hypothetical protein
MTCGTGWEMSGLPARRIDPRDRVAIRRLRRRVCRTGASARSAWLDRPSRGLHPRQGKLRHSLQDPRFSAPAATAWEWRDRGRLWIVRTVADRTVVAEGTMRRQAVKRDEERGGLKLLAPISSTSNAELRLPTCWSGMLFPACRWRAQTRSDPRSRDQARPDLPTFSPLSRGSPTAGRPVCVVSALLPSVQKTTVHFPPRPEGILQSLRRATPKRGSPLSLLAFPAGFEAAAYGATG